MKNPKLFWHIFPPTLFLAFSFILLFAWHEGRVFSAFHNQQIQEKLIGWSRFLIPQVKELSDSNRSYLQDFCRRAGRITATRITVLDSKGTVLADSSESPSFINEHHNQHDYPEVIAGGEGEVGKSWRFDKTFEQYMVFVAIPFDFDERGSGVLRLGVPGSQWSSFFYFFNVKVFLVGSGFVFLVALLAWLLSRKIRFFLEEVATGVRQIADRKTGQSLAMVDSNAPKEIAALANNLNNVAKQVNKRVNLVIQQRNELELVFSSMTDGVLAVGTDHRVIRINRAAIELFNLDDMKVRGKIFEGVIRARPLQEFLSMSLQEEVVTERELVLHGDEYPITLHVRAIPLYDETGTRIGILVVMSNLTRLNKLENIRQDFVANVSHELKTPITSICGYVETLLDGALDDRQAAGNFLKIIARQGRRLEAIVEDLLTLARIEDNEGKESAQLEMGKIKPVLEAATQTCSVQAGQKNMAIKVDCDPALTGRVNPPILEQAIVNLLTNSIVYCPAGTSVILSAGRQNAGAGTGFIRISVSDQGPGIADQHRERIFERFYRCDKARSRKHGGTGLGLAIVKHIAAAHNGRVELQSAHGQGAVFSIIIPGD